MSRDNRKNFEDEKVGYGRPPKASRFKKGQSGNPSGRPKKQPSFPELLEKELRASVNIQEGGHLRTITKKEAIVKGMTNKAMKGCHQARRDVINLEREFPAPPEELKIVSFTMKMED
jgi:hypothetical protein